MPPLRATKQFARSPADQVRRELESNLERAERRVRESEARVARQGEILEQRRAHGDDTRLSEDLLRTFEETLALQRRHLGQLRERNKLPPQD